MTDSTDTRATDAHAADTDSTEEFLSALQYDQAVDLLGDVLGANETEILDIYRRLLALARRDDLPPCAAAGVRSALAATANVVNDLALVFEHLLDVEV